MLLCALIPLSVIVLLHKVLALPANLAAIGGIVASVVSMFAVTPLSFKIYGVIAKAKYGKIPNDAVVHTTDAGCASLIFVLFILILYPVFINAQKKREANFKKQNAAHSQIKRDGVK